MISTSHVLTLGTLGERGIVQLQYFVEDADLLSSDMRSGDESRAQRAVQALRKRSNLKSSCRINSWFAQNHHQMRSL
jgi:hypothetical protein